MKRKSPLVSIIIIDYKKENPYIAESFEAIKSQSYTNYEIILVTDYRNDYQTKSLRKKYYGKYVPPANKRDQGAKMAKGEILAFLDDDAYPSKNWLKNIVKGFEDKDVVGIGGPGVTPPNTSFLEKASGWASASLVGSGSNFYRFLPRKKRFVDDYPSMNLAVRRKDFLKIGGFDSHYWPGEDTKLCLDLTHKLNKKILYLPEVLVYHHRRPLWIPHLKQNGNFGIHRGNFARILPQTSFRIEYFGPSLLFLGLLYLLISFFIPSLSIVFVVKVGIILSLLYSLILLVNGVWIYKKSKDIWQGIISIPAILITNLWYGIRFIQGFLFSGKLKR